VETFAIRCSGGETPDQQIALIAHKLSRVMEISDWRNNEADGVVEMDVREAKSIPLELMFEEAAAKTWKTQKATKREIEAVASYIFGQRLVIDQELFGTHAYFIHCGF
jgi:hypothetical protein